MSTATFPKLTDLLVFDCLSHEAKKLGVEPKKQHLADMFPLRRKFIFVRRRMGLLMFGFSCSGTSIPDAGCADIIATRSSLGKQIGGWFRVGTRQCCWPPLIEFVGISIAICYGFNCVCCARMARELYLLLLENLPSARTASSWTWIPGKKHAC